MGVLLEPQRRKHEARKIVNKAGLLLYTLNRVAVKGLKSILRVHVPNNSVPFEGGYIEIHRDVFRV